MTIHMEYVPGNLADRWNVAVVMERLRAAVAADNRETVVGPAHGAVFFVWIILGLLSFQVDPARVGAAARAQDRVKDLAIQLAIQLAILLALLRVHNTTTVGIHANRVVVVIRVVSRDRSHLVT